MKGMTLRVHAEFQLCARPLRAQSIELMEQDLTAFPSASHGETLRCVLAQTFGLQGKIFCKAADE